MSRPPVDTDALLSLVDDDSDLLRSIIDAFLEECSGHMEALRAAVAEEDAEALQREAHSLKGSTGNLRAEPTHEVATKLEQIGERNDFHEAEEALAALEREIERLQDALVEIREEHTNGGAYCSDGLSK